MFNRCNEVSMDGFGDIWKQIFSPIKQAGSVIEQRVIRPIARPIGKPILKVMKQVEEGVIDPYLKPLIKPIARVMPKITIAGHRYDLGGSQMLQKTITGFVGGAASTWFTGYGVVYGGICGALAANLRHGKPNVLQDLGMGVAGGIVGAYGAEYIGGAGASAGGGASVTPSVPGVISPGITAAEAASYAATAGTAIKLGQQTGLIKTGQLPKTPTFDPDAVAFPPIEPGIFSSPNAVPIGIGISVATIVGLMVLNRYH